MAGFATVSGLARGRMSARTRQTFMVVLSVAFLFVLHGACAVYVLVLVMGAYGLARHLAGAPGAPYGLAAVWVYCCGSLFLARLWEGLPFASISPALAFLDAHRGMLRWHIHYNLMILRLISFASDLAWARGARRATPGGRGPVHTAPPAVAAVRSHSAGGAEGLQDGSSSRGPVEGVDGGGEKGGGSSSSAAVLAGATGLDQEIKARVEEPLPLSQYSLAGLLEYCLYPPLYIAGPIITFNCFSSQRAPGGAMRQLGGRQLLVYAARATLVLLCLEAVTHALPYNAIARDRALDKLAARWAADPAGAAAAGLPRPRPLHYAITGYWVLVFMWLKFTFIWRFFRLAALADGVAPPENMTRCVCDNYDVEGFWRSWHASYNRWLVRYMYVPLGGARWRAANVWAIFTFVALWHDLEWRLLGWAWMMAAAIAPEMAVKALGRSRLLRQWHGTAAFRHAAAAAAAINILLLMTANLVGFVTGLDGIGPLAKQVLAQPRFLAVVLLALFSAAQLMFWKRECEAAGRERVVAAAAAGTAGAGTQAGKASGRP
ncbi:hypothetical protein HYH02_007492 [Chlamydomonas schloesseri]|uniref:Membrane bound O-acyl transferase n=1 Tax=Chlamydomonas schloesseri TaxID=2026947 RepID=A0A835WH90_9CHLO|nr:hypothetical protein HYH02_007492 [Chlamydomonas schloesseri]|eukprot:KAG2447569.1 hypothetical protein HYH02_007492 [Chlamydomonas schloesseri]